MLQRLLECAHQELDLNKMRYEQVEHVTRATKETTEQLSKVKSQMQENATRFVQKRQQVVDMKERVDNIYKIEVARKAWATFFQGLIILFFGWCVYRFIRK